MTEADHPQGFPKIHKERQMGKAGTARGQLEEKAAGESSSVLTWGKVAGKSLLLCVPFSPTGDRR